MCQHLERKFQMSRDEVPKKKIDLLVSDKLNFRCRFYIILNDEWIVSKLTKQVNCQNLIANHTD